MVELAKRKDLIITNADKGGAAVIIDTDRYNKETNWQLSDKAIYKQLTQVPTLQHNIMVNQTIERFKNEKLLPRKITDGLKVTTPKTPRLYISSKIGKPNNPGRLVINLNECSHIRNFEVRWSPTGGKTSSLFTILMKWFVSFINKYISFINKVNNFSVPINSNLVTTDVRSLYTSIRSSNNEGIAPTKKRYDSYVHRLYPLKLPQHF